MYSQSVLYDYAMRMVGLPYRWAGDDTIAGFDCSGLSIELLKSAGIVPNNYDSTATDLRNFLLNSGAKETTKANFGSLVFFGSTEKAGHVGFCFNNELMLEAGGGGSKVKTEADAIKYNAFIRVRPISIRGDRISIVNPNYPWSKDGSE